MIQIKVVAGFGDYTMYSLSLRNALLEISSVMTRLTPLIFGVCADNMALLLTVARTFNFAGDMPTNLRQNLKRGDLSCL
jgi:hypothetical protein